MSKKTCFLFPVCLFLFFAAYCQSSPLTEGFNTVSSSALPGWSFINRSSGSSVSNWAQGNTNYFSAQSGPANSYIQSFGFLPPQTFISNWLITPQRALHNGDIITFYTRSLANASEALEVRLTTNGNSSNVGTNAGSTGDFNTLLLTVNPTFTRYAYPTTWTKFTITLGGLSGTPYGRFAFRHVNQSSSQGGEASVGIDSFTYISYPAATRLYVDSAAAASSNGLSWGAPFKTLNEAFDIANTYNNITEIWVKKGTYYPDEGPDRTANDRNLSFSLKTGLTIYGGFAGGEMDLNLRDPRTYTTILSGEIQQDNDTANNAYHVIQTSGLDNTAVLDGFTIKAGNANGSASAAWGGGMYNYNSSPSLVNCSFSQNEGYFFGGGMANHDNSSPRLVNCSFSQNIALRGGGMHNDNSSSPSLLNCSFSQNTSISLGGGMTNNRSSSPSLVNCSFLQNTASYSGGGMDNASSSPSLVNCSFSQNQASEIGSGMYNYNSSPSLVNCSFSQNTATASGYAMYNYYFSSPSLVNCILWGNTNSQIDNEFNSTPTVSWSIVQGGYDGTKNSDVDPIFVNADSPAGADGIFGTADDGLRLQAGSPAINAGNNDSIAGITTDITGALRIQNDTVDMGAYEGALTSIFSITSGPWNNPATWSCNCVPQGTTQVTIKVGHTVSVTATMGNLQCGKLRLEATSIFNVTGGLFKIVGSD